MKLNALEHWEVEKALRQWDVPVERLEADDRWLHRLQERRQTVALAPAPVLHLVAQASRPVMTLPLPGRISFLPAWAATAALLMLLPLAWWGARQTMANASSLEALVQSQPQAVETLALYSGVRGRAESLALPEEEAFELAAFTTSVESAYGNGAEFELVEEALAGAGAEEREQILALLREDIS